MRHIFLSFAAAIAILATAGCGFTPVHAGSPSFSNSSNISVSEIPGRAGHELRKAIVEELGAGLPGVETATLRVTLRERLNRIPIRVDATAARTDINVTGRFVLDIGDDALTGTQTAQSSFNVPISVFGDITAQQAATDRIMNVLAQRIVDDLKLQLKDRAP